MADLVLVPREPTEEQLEAGLDASGNRVSASPADYIDGAMVEPGMSEAEAAEINGWLKDALRGEYKAMIASAPSQEGAVTDRDSIIEECARIADLHASSQEEREMDGNYEFHEGRDYSCDEIARAIRSLKKRDGSDKT